MQSENINPPVLARQVHKLGPLARRAAAPPAPLRGHFFYLTSSTQRRLALWLCLMSASCAVGRVCAGPSLKTGRETTAASSSSAELSSPSRRSMHSRSLDMRTRAYA